METMVGRASRHRTEGFFAQAAWRHRFPARSARALPVCRYGDVRCPVGAFSAHGFQVQDVWHRGRHDDRPVDAILYSIDCRRVSEKNAANSTDGTAHAPSAGPTVPSSAPGNAETVPMALNSQASGVSPPSEGSLGTREKNRGCLTSRTAGCGATYQL